jgi:hypothetical protein
MTHNIPSLHQQPNNITSPPPATAAAAPAAVAIEEKVKTTTKATPGRAGGYDDNARIAVDGKDLPCATTTMTTPLLSLLAHHTSSGVRERLGFVNRAAHEVSMIGSDTMCRVNNRETTSM